MEASAVKLGKGRKGLYDLAVQLDAFARDQLKRAPHAAFAERERGCKRLGLSLAVVANECPAYGLRQVIIAKSPQAKRPRARADGNGEPSLGVGDQQKQRARRRLFQSLKQSVR